MNLYRDVTEFIRKTCDNILPQFQFDSALVQRRVHSDEVQQAISNLQRQIDMIDEAAAIEHMLTPLSLKVIKTTLYKQNRKHKRPRINKKWKKRFGEMPIEVQSEDVIMGNTNCIYVTERGFNRLKINLRGASKHASTRRHRRKNENLLRANSKNTINAKNSSSY